MRISRNRPALIGLSALILAGTATSASAVTGTVDGNTLTAAQIAQTLVGPGVVISNVTATGDATARGTFSGGATSVGFDTGVALSSGNIADTAGPTNDSTGTTTAFYAAGDADLSTLSGFNTFDASVLEFDFTPNADTVYFRYVFGSEEYNEYVNTQFNDVFAFFVNGTNCAVVPDPAVPGGTLPVTINSVNNGTNASLYKDNTASPNPYATELDGLTIPLTCMAPVNTGVPNHMKLAIADSSDYILDSGVFLEQGSLSTTPPSGIGKVTGGGEVSIAGGRASLGTTVIKDEQGLRGNLQVNDHTTGDRFHGYAVDSLSVVDNTATWSGTGRLNGVDGYTFEVSVVDNRNGNTAKKGPADTISIVIKDGGGLTVWSLTEGSLKKGNITVHKG
ncbi:choice-of-anchor L domain-containing protein [Intrasporangium calvum]|uniref:Choice-of-anchor L domain-containing protein n=1 Tax=Intrasporangium calvum TaxID=53358 RepID=A0ABT5GJF3_9MICO|nr:choice-of-anchor L domain-containing protein [Intrasporangium calvum]MDC5698126.1 choice-of-anchor L domain-containing protein [Intrasporangium calvum]